MGFRERGIDRVEWIERHKITSLYRRHAPLTHDGSFDSSGDREDHAVKVIVDRATGRDLSIFTIVYYFFPDRSSLSRRDALIYISESRYSAGKLEITYSC